MKRVTTIALVIFLSLLTACLMPAQVFADSLPEYISEVKIFMDSYKDADAEGYELLSETDKNGKATPVDLNQGAGGGWGSKGDKSVYLGYKTTTNSKEAITDLALMNMKGGYSVAEYDALMETYMKSQITPFVESFLAAVREYRENYNSDIESNRLRAQSIHDILNKYTDDDCSGAPLGDLLLNETKFEMGDEAYNKLSEEEKKEHCDILTLIAQANGKVTLVIENLLTRAADTNEDTWLDRLSGITYDDLVDATGMLPTDAAKSIIKKYDDDARMILDKWDEFSSSLADYDGIIERIENFNPDEIKKAYDDLENLPEDASDEKIEAASKALIEAQEKEAKMLSDARAAAVHDCLAEIDYSYDGEETTMLDFFMLSYDEIYDNVEWLYPLVASLTEGQRAGLEFVSLAELVAIANTDSAEYDEETLEQMDSVSVYDGVDRAIYQKGGVALTSDALRSNVASESLNKKSLSGATITLIVFSSIATIAFLASVGFKVYFSSMASRYSAQAARLSADGSWRMAGDLHASRIISMQNSKFMNGFVKGFGAAMVILSAITVYLSYRDMVNYYNVDFTPIPHYMVDEKDITGYNSKGEKVVLKNQSAYYKAVECNRKTSAEFYKTLGICADMNGDVGSQWLALYAAKNEAMQPILASSLKAVVDSYEVPAGYETGIHMFGSSAAFNLNSGLYDWNQSAKSVFVYFKVDTSAPKTAGSNFTGSTLALTGGAGLAVGALATALGMTATKKKKEEK